MMNYSESTKEPLQMFRERRERMQQHFKKALFLAVLLAFVGGVLSGVLGCRYMVEKPATVEPEAALFVPSVEVEPVAKLEHTIIRTAPEPYDPPPDPEGPVLLGTYRITAYCSCEICCGEWAKNRPGGIVYGAAMIELKPGVSCAAPSLPFGTEITVEGLGNYVVQDRPSKWVIDKYGDEQIDIYFSSHEAAESFGLKYLNVYLKEDVTT